MDQRGFRGTRRHFDPKIPRATGITSSDGNREDAHGDVSSKGDISEKSFEQLLDEKLDLENEIRQYSDAALLSKQLQLRDSLPEDRSFSEYMKLKTAWMTRRAEIASQIRNIEMSLRAAKRARKEHRKDRDNIHDSEWSVDSKLGIWRLILEQLIGIREELVRMRTDAMKDRLR